MPMWYSILLSVFVYVLPLKSSNVKSTLANVNMKYNSLLSWISLLFQIQKFVSSGYKVAKLQKDQADRERKKKKDS